MNQKQWQRIAAENEHTTWDEVVECSDDLTSDDRDIVTSLGYYGKKVYPIHGALIAQRKPWKSVEPYLIIGSGPEGASEHGFSDLEVAKKWIKEHIQWCNCFEGTSFNADHANYSLVGFTLQDVGINPLDRAP